MSAISTIDTLAHTNRWAERHIADKLLWAGGLVVAALVVPVFPGALLVIVAVAVSASFAGIHRREMVTVLRVPLGFIAAGAFATSISLRTAGGVSLGLGDVHEAIELAVRSAAGTSAAVLLAMTVPMSELLGRSRRVGVPAVACEVALLMYRMIAVGLDRLRWQRVAQESRLGYVGLRRSVRSAALLAVSTFVGSVGHAQRLTIGLGARNFEGDLPVLHDDARHSLRFIAVSVVAIVVIVAGSYVIAGIR